MVMSIFLPSLTVMCISAIGSPKPSLKKDVDIDVCKGKGPWRWKKTCQNQCVQRPRTITLIKHMSKSMCLKAKALKANTVKADTGNTVPLSGLPLEHGYVNFFAQSYGHVHIADRLPQAFFEKRCRHRCVQRQRGKPQYIHERRAPMFVSSLFTLLAWQSAAPDVTRCFSTIGVVESIGFCGRKQTSGIYIAPSRWPFFVSVLRLLFVGALLLCGCCVLCVGGPQAFFEHEMSTSMFAKAKDHNVQTMHVEINVCNGKGP